MSGTELGLFAKYWQPGQVKTRLADELGELSASQVHRCFLECLLQRFAQLGDVRTLVLTPESRQNEFAKLPVASWQLQPQSSGHLGARIAHYLATALAGGRSRVVLLGSDSPSLPAEYVLNALVQLERHPVVLGPADDGGYYLVGVSGNVPPMFEGIDWGSPHVWQQTLARLDELNVPAAVLPSWYDVDRPDDLSRLRAELVDADDPHLAQLGRQLNEIIAA